MQGCSLYHCLFFLFFFFNFSIKDSFLVHLLACDKKSIIQNEQIHDDNHQHHHPFVILEKWASMLSFQLQLLSALSFF